MDELGEFEKQDLDHRLPSARHEFGHFAVARHLGFRTGGVTIAADGALAGPGGTSETYLIPALKTITEVNEYCRDRVKILCAGVLAEAIEDGEINNERAKLYAKHSGSNDHAKATEHIRILRGIMYPLTTDEAKANEEANALYDEIWADAFGIVTKYISFINKMSEELALMEVARFERPQLSEEQLDAHDLVREIFPK